jgi:uncharacterized caspase-like protein
VILRVLFVAAILVASPLAAHAAQAMHGVALVIGESKYEQLPVLANPSKDARDIDRLLGDLGFDVDRVLNADGDELLEAIARFEEQARDADVALIYYSGHGIEAKGQNFIAPVDTDLRTPQSAGASMIAVQPILDALARVAPVSIILLDACRSDPFPPGQTIVLPGDIEPTPVEGHGLAAVRGPTPVAVKAADPDSFGSVIGFSASPGEPALDGAPGENSPYAAALLKHFAAGGYSFSDVMTMVTEEVYLKTRARQLPWTNSSLRKVLNFDAPADEDVDTDQSAIKSERRKLLLTIANTPVATQKYVEQLAGQEKVPLDALYGMLDVLGIKTGDAGGDIEQQLQKGAERLKQIIAEKPQPVKTDPELERLSKLADDAEAEGAIALALTYRDEASGRADTLLDQKQKEAEQLRQDMLDIAATYAQNAATALLNFDHRHAAELYGKAYAAVKDWDKAQALTYKIGQGDALYDQGYYRADNSALTTALLVYRDALALAPREADPAGWSEVRDRMGQAQQVLGDRLTDPSMLQTSLLSYRAALEVRTQADMPMEWANTQNNLGNVLYAIGMRKHDTTMLDDAAAAMQAALTVFTPAATPAKWSVTLSNLTTVRIDRAALTYAATDSAEMTAAAAGVADATNIPEVVKARSDANAILDTALTALQSALDAQGSTLNPLDWAMLNHTLASGYEQKGEMNHSAPDLRKAVELYENVLRVHTRERTPAQWVRSSNNLAITLKKLADETGDPAPLRRAVGIYRDVVATTSRESLPLDWADYQQNLGNALAALADYEDAGPNLDAALAAYQAAGEITTVARGAGKWQGLQTAIATTLLMKGLKTMDRAPVLEAQRITLAARDKMRELGAPDEEFYTQYLGAVDKVLALLPK